MRETSSGESESSHGRARAAKVAGALAVVLALLWFARPASPPATIPGEAPAPAAASPTEKLSPVFSRAPVEPAARSWPRLKPGISLLEHGNHEEAARFFERETASGNLSGDEAGMAIYYQADALFALDRLADAASLYRKFLEAHPSMPAADNARSALEYIARSAEYKKALAGGSKP
ncbi:MAG: hypothetical protein HY303_18295 [Candidatus Wallbacteria bacterium]|nr:hypothetical protein [Candidatus Wallbacteria bacterium]